MVRKIASERRIDPDRPLVLRAQDGDLEAMGDLFLRHAPAVRRLLASVLGPGADLDDLLQDVFIQIHRSLPSFRGHSLFSTWLHQVVVFAAYNHLRRTRGRSMPVEPEALDACPSRVAGPYDKLVSAETIRRLRAALEAIKPKKRVAFLLFSVNGLSVAEVAEMVGAPIPTVKSRIWFARRELLRKARRDPYLAALMEELDEDRSGQG